MQRKTINKYKKKLKAIGRRNRQFIELVCKQCKRVSKVRVNDKAIYTEEVIKNWICFFCTLKRGGVR